MKSCIKVLCSLIIALVVPTMIFAQETDDLEDSVLDAFTALEQGYSYTGETSFLQAFITEDETFNSSLTETLNAQVDADGNFYITRLVDASGTTDAPEDLEPLLLEELQWGDDLYLKVTTENVLTEEALPMLTEDWQRLADLLEGFDEFSVERISLENFSRIQLPSEAMFRASLIDNVEELPSETVNDIEMRVFSVEMDALTIFISQSPGTPLERAQALLEGSDLLENSELSLHHTFWIGAEDGNIYQWEIESYTSLPYMSTESENLPYDIEQEFTASYVFVDHGDVTAIEEIAEQVGIEPAP